MPPSLKERVGALINAVFGVDSIPSSVEIREELDENVHLPIDELAAKLASWAVEAYREKMKAGNSHGDKGLILKCPYVVSFEVHDKAHRILYPKGWFYRDNFVNNTVFITPCQPSNFFGLKPAY